ncbi:hypothetical protein [Proteiniphilum sp. X52]|uniref:hypothetical protein n=1 Tax=Proteiniphilum sp. X52 TaxID=2382159 RepID=UPI000F0A3C8F|nr:hypothetical protein [Proteiniphilum sp. X52]RNC66434.1 hypothetical protein D7D25_02855 [Proteiniphilum sp. X52]
MTKDEVISIMEMFFKKFDTNPNKLAVDIKVSPQSIYDVMNEKKPNVGISKRLAKKISDKYPVNETYFLTGAGPMLKSEVESISAQSQASDHVDGFFISNKVFEQISRLTETVLSQQRTIEMLAGKKTDVG